MQNTETLKQTLKATNTLIENPSEEKNTNPLVRVIADIPAFIGPDMKTYILKKQDILSIPKEIAEPLKKRGVVQPLI